MLPDFIKSSVQQYQEDTNAIAAWLANSARQCGYSTTKLHGGQNKAQPPRSTRLKGKARKQARQNGSLPPKQKPIYTVASKDYIGLAEFIASSTNPRIEVPRLFIHTLDRAIAERKEHSIYRTVNGLAHDTASNERHAFFISILEQVRKTLRPSMRVEEEQKEEEHHPVNIPATGTSQEQAKEVVEAIDELSVQKQCEEYYKDVVEPAVTPAEIPEAFPEADYKAEERDLDLEERIAFRFLLRDLNKLEDFVDELWHMYRDRKLDLVTTAITTNTAIDFARRLEEDVRYVFARHVDGPSTLLEAFWDALASERGEDPDFVPDRFDDINLNLYEDSTEFMYPTFCLLKAALEMDRMRDPRRVISFDPDIYGTYNPQADRSKMTPKEKYWEDRQIFLNILPELFFRGCVPNTFAEDEFVNGFETMCRTKRIPLWVVFATQVYINIHHTLREHAKRPFEELKCCVWQIEDSIVQARELHRGIKHKGWGKKEDAALQELLNNGRSWVLSDSKHGRTRCGHDHGAPEAFIAKHPIWAGLIMYNLQSQFQEAGTFCANSWGVVMYTSQLYNAVRHECPDVLGGESWPDMELVGKLHAKDIFPDGAPPSSPEAYLKHAYLSMGFSPTKFARNTGRPGMMSGRRARQLSLKAPTLQHFRHRYTEGSGRIDMTAVDLEVILGERAPGVRGKKVSLTEMLDALTDALAAERQEFCMDFLALHNSCWKVLKEVVGRCGKMLSPVDGGGCFAGAQLSDVVYCIFEALAEPLGDDVPIREAAKILARNVSEGLGEDVLRTLEGVYGTEMASEEARLPGTGNGG